MKIEDAQTRKIIVIILTMAFAIMIIKTAWVSDDSYITLRTVDNFINGYGIVWNTGERVQAYTHPLWMFLVSAFYAIRREGYFILIDLSIVLSILAFFILGIKISKNWLAVFAGLIILLLSKSYIDYSTSGLENPVSNLLLILFAITLFTQKDGSFLRIFLLGLFACLAIFNRLDIGLLFIPILLYELILFRNRKAVKLVILSFLPMIIWEFFSVIYYGFLIPNTAFAKLGTGISLFQYLRQGIMYFINSLIVDPITLLIIGITLVFVFLGKSTREKIFGIGIVLYLLYIVYIGGDFMSGRLFSLPFLACVILLIKYLESLPKIIVPIGLTAVFIFFIINLVVSSYSAIPLIDNKGIADERLYYFPTSGLININRLHHPPTYPTVEEGKALHDNGTRVTESGQIGFLGFYAGSKVYIVDRLGLANPFLARLPITDKILWRIGHFSREIPPGYLETLTTGTNKITNPSLSEYYEKLMIIVRGPIWEWNRFVEIWKMNTGQYNYLLNK